MRKRKFGYQIILLKKNELTLNKSIEFLNILGEKGWELVSVTSPIESDNVTFIFKTELS